MSKKISDWRKLVGRIVEIPPHVEQPTKAMRRTHLIARTEAAFVREGPHGFHAFKYAEFMRFVARITKVHESNPDILVSTGRFGLRATAHGLELPAETEERLRNRRDYLKQRLRNFQAERDSCAEDEKNTIALLDDLLKLLPKKQKKKRKKRS